jgi:hypothetical protein
MLSYARAQQLFSTARSAEAGKPLANNTRLIRVGTMRVDQVDLPVYGVKLHSTVIVSIYPDGSYRLYAGGWQTPTTKDRINAYAPVRIYQRQHVWYMADGSEYVDNMVVHTEPVAAVISRLAGEEVIYA